MKGRIGYVVLDTVDPERIVGFWSELLGRPIEDRLNDGQYVILAAEPGSPGFSLQRVPEEKSGKNRMHLDLVVDDLDQATSRIEALGGSWRDGQTRELEGYIWRNMADPEGNEFDIVKGTSV
jgi:predicted enzyme related to lactoylglutathione lyase